MVRWYGESVAVRPVTDDQAALGTPAMFLWRDRVYVVREVLGHWRERRSWWAQADSPLVECDVWRIEAGAGGFGRGVYDLGVEVGTGSTDQHWRLLRALD